ncbi:hypothetical protein DSO57_1021531 [Entomophthora muscae]|uniref:Uncharacterized protein n=1 Tax=Entomophthora muscae TaxID=34485 RepID=A0ACC2SG20_9FUNG|nr:hypothetical protein DSO57_1021531 [Entomophthora muscae]
MDYQELAQLLVHCSLASLGVPYQTTALAVYTLVHFDVLHAALLYGSFRRCNTLAKLPSVQPAWSPCPDDTHNSWVVQLTLLVVLGVVNGRWGMVWACFRMLILIANMAAPSESNI